MSGVLFVTLYQQIAVEKFLKLMKSKEKLTLYVFNEKFYIVEETKAVTFTLEKVIEMDKDSIWTDIKHLTYQQRHEVIKAFEIKKGVNDDN